MHQPYADVRVMDLGHWPADGKALVKKVGRALDKLKSRIHINRILRAATNITVYGRTSRFSIGM